MVGLFVALLLARPCVTAVTSLTPQAWNVSWSRYGYSAVAPTTARRLLALNALICACACVALTRGYFQQHVQIRRCMDPLYARCIELQKLTVRVK
jgi:hypothetical protein